MATANSTDEVRPNPTPTDEAGERQDRRYRTTYTVPNPAEKPALFTLLQALGDLHQLGRMPEGDGLIWNTDEKSLNHLATHVEEARLVIADGISGIGTLLFHATLHDEIPAHALIGIGRLLHELGEATFPLSELEYAFREGRGRTE